MELFFVLLSLCLFFILKACLNNVLLGFPNRRFRKLPPGPRGLPLIGNLLMIGDRPHESLTELAKIHGPLMTVKLGFATTVVASSAEMAKEMFQKNDRACMGRAIPDAVTAETDHHLSLVWSSGGPHWTNLRKLCNTQLFTAQRLDQLQHLRHQIMDNMVSHVAEARDAKEGIFVGRLVFGTSLNLLSNTMFSGAMLDAKSDAMKELKVLMARIMELAGRPNLADCFPFLRRFDPQGIRREIKVSYDRLHELLEDMIDQRMKRRASGSPRCGDFLDVLFDHSEKHGDEFDRRNINILLSDLFIGGTDTTSTTIEWAMTELLRNPTIMAKAKTELALTIGSKRSIQEQDLPKLPYLDAIIKETMRLHPTAPLLLPHRAETEVEVCGYTIPKHTQILVNAWSMAQDASYWVQPKNFTPERFLSSEVDFVGKNFAFIPFGAGRRICPGLGLGIRMLKLVLANLLYHFDWKLPNGMLPQELDMQDKFGVTLQKAIPLVAIPVAVGAAIP
ncbi:geraniol 8-hydroxylase-like [Diospyros lotus]|uniref:geraniol 8-hydroxylase-like n=1 Tax=Diospyros lotus TaxID=55363 RepID=UPI002259B09D|nr:geraniol 8-hydroxylase-like [Diospyros lotus]